MPRPEPPRRHAIRWTEPALQDLLEITEYIKRDKPQAAKLFAKAVKEKVVRLGRFPFSGRAVPEFPGSGLLEIVVGNYRVIYRAISTKSRVEILTVRHGARRLEGEDVP